MKRHYKFNLLISAFAVFISNWFPLFGQDQRQVTPNGIFDKVYDGIGNYYELAELSTSAPKIIGKGTNTAFAAPIHFCNVGYFKLYADPNSTVFNGNNAFTTAARDLLCELFSNISSFITSNTPTATI